MILTSIPILPKTLTIPRAPRHFKILSNSLADINKSIYDCIIVSRFNKASIGPVTKLIKLDITQYTP